MELSLLKALLGHISLYFRLSSGDSINSEVVLKYHQKGEEILKLLKPVLDAIVDSEIAYQEKLDKAFEDLSHSVDKLRDLFENWKPLSSKVYFVLQSEALISKIQKSTLDTFQILQSLHEYLPVKLSSTSVELCIQKIKHMGNEQTFIIIKDALRNQVEGVEPSAEALLKIAEPLNLRSNEGILIEAVALEKLKEKAEQAENAGEVEYIDQIISIVTLLHEHLIVIDQSQITSSVLIPADFCCPLSLKLMTDPVIVSSGQTYERAFIKRWIDLGLNVCPKTRQTLSHTNLIPNYTVKALIANWCELNNVKLPDPTKPIIINNVSLESKNQSMGSPGNKVNSSSGSTTHQEGPSPSDDSLTTITANGSGSDITTVSQKNSGEILPGSEDKSGHSAPSRTNLQEISGVQLDLPQNHNKTSSASSVVSDSGGFPRGNLGDNNEAYSSDNSGEVRSESPLNTTPLTAPQREPEYSPRLMEARTRTHSIWRRPSERYVPKIVSSSASETRPDLSGIETQVKGLVEDLKSDSDETLLAATAEIRLLAKHSMDNRIVIANCAAINFLVDLLRSNISKIQENAVTALLNLSINDNNKTAIAQANAIEPLIHVLETGSPEAKENSAATLFSLSVIEDNKAKIGRSGAIGPLVDLLGNGTPRGKKDAATALFNLSIFHENKSRIVEAGAVKYLVELMDPAAGIVDKVVAALANLSTVPEGRTAIGEEGGIPVLVEVVELGSSRSKENAAAALLQLCTTSNRFCNMVLQEGAVPPLVALSQSGTPRAKEKAQALLSFFRNHRQQGNAGRG